MDELGGMSTALKLAKKAAGIPDAEDVKLQVFPKAKSPLEQILGGPRENSEPQAAAAAVLRVLETTRPAVRRLRALGLWDEPGMLAMPPLGWEAYGTPSE